MKSSKVQGRSSFQTTLVRKATVESVGIHSGKKIRCIIHPAPANHGIVFVRSDIKALPKIKADISRVVRTDMCTTLGDDNSNIVATVEHLMAALSGMGVDNVLIELSGPEVPIMDGSALQFTLAIADAGIKILKTPKKILKLKKAVGVRHNDKWVYAQPATTLSISGSIEFKHRVIGEQKFTFNQDMKFSEDLAGARTFGFLKEVEYLQKKGLALGGSLENAIVLDDEKVLNPTGLRFNDEFVRHKVLDALGDLSLAGMNILADVQLYKSGHELHTGILKKIFEDAANYEIVELSTEEETETKVVPIAGLGLVVSA